MEDIAPKLLETIKAGFESRMVQDKKIIDLYRRVRDGTATYRQAQDFAIAIGNILSEIYEENLYSGMLPDGKLYYNIANRIIPPMLENNYNLTCEVAMAAQENINRASGIGLKAVKPNLNQDKISGIVDIVSGKDNFDEIAYMLKDPIVNFTQCVVDDTVKANADFQDKSGLSPKIIRTSSGKCCDWCSRLVGTYAYEKVKDTGNDVFRRHKNCKCLVEFAEGGMRQNVHSKEMVSDEDIKRRISNSFAKELSTRTREQAKALEESLKIKYMKS